MNFSDNSNGIGVSSLKREVEKLRKELHELRSHKKSSYEEKYAAAFRSNPNALVLSHKITGKILEANDVFLDLIGKKKEEVLNNTSISLNIYADPDDREQMLSLIRKYGSIKNFETSINHSSGEKRSVLISAEVLVIDGEKQILSNIQDITDLKQIENDLRTSKEQYQLLIESANSIIMRYNSRGIITYANPFAISFFGFTRDELIGGSVTRILPERETSGRDLHNLIGDIFNNPENYQHFENENIRKNGEYAWIGWTNRAIYNEQGHVEEILTIGNDMTDRKKAEDALKMEHNILEAVITNIGVGFVVSDGHGNIISMNKAASAIHGFKNEQEGLIHLRDYAVEFDLENHDGTIITSDKWPLSLALKGQFVNDYKIVMVNHKRHFRKTVSYNAVPIYNASGSPVYIILTIADHTEDERRTNIIRHERELFEGIVNNIPVMINIYDPCLKTHRFNNEFTRVMGWTEQDTLEGDFMAKVYPDPDYRNQVVEYMQNLKTGWKELRLKARDGSVIESEWANIKLSDGIMIGIGIDIRERKQSEEKIRLNEQRLQAIFDKAAIGIVEIDDMDRYIRVNDRICQILNYSREELLGKSITDITYADDVDLTKDLNDKLHKGELRIFHYEKRYTRKDGTPIWVHVSVSSILDSQGKYIKSIGTVEDISERKKSDEKLLKALGEAEEGKNILMALMKYIPIGITIADAPEVKIRMMSQYGLDMLQTNLSDLTSKPFQERSLKMGFFHPDTKTPGKAEEMPLARAVLKSEIIKNEEWMFKTADGSFTAITCNAAPILDREGNTTGGVIAWQDITEQKENEKEIRQKNEELTRFIYTVSHDLKSPLVTIKSFTEYLKEDIEASDMEAQEKDMAYIRNAADKMGSLLDELLELSRIGRKENPKTVVTLNEVVQSALDLVAGSISKKKIVVKQNCDQIMLFGYTQRIIQLYQNLIDNAAKFMGDQPCPEIEIGTTADDQHEILLYVKDNGSGIDPRYHHKVFGLFEKLDNLTEGTGIGLALVKRIVELHGGKIWFESAGTGKGTTFYFTLSNSYRIN